MSRMSITIFMEAACVLQVLIDIDIVLIKGSLVRNSRSYEQSDSSVKW